MLSDYYKQLLIIQYRNKPKASGIVSAFVDNLDIVELAKAVERAFDLDTAIGKQLDILAKYVGVSRIFEGINGLIELSDEDLRVLIRLGIIKNSSGTSLADIQNLLSSFFAGAIKVYDNKDMTMTYVVNTSIITSDFLAEAFLTGNLLPRPMGVGLSTIFTDKPESFFGYVTYDRQDWKNTPYNLYEDYNMSWNFLTYDYAENIVIPEDITDLDILATEDLDPLTQENGYEIIV